MTIEEMDEAYSNLKTEYFDIQDKLTTARQCEDCYKRDILKLQKQLEIAVEALEDYAESDNWELENEKYIYWEKKGHSYPWRLGLKALKEIKELEK